jgi:hypothetical protein
MTMALSNGAFYGDDENDGRPKIKTQPPEDIIPEKTFIFHGRGCILDSYRKDDKWFTVPYKSIFFKYLGYQRQIPVVHLSTYTTKSKLEKEFIMNHKYWGNMITEYEENKIC